MNPSLRRPGGPDYDLPDRDCWTRHAEWRYRLPYDRCAPLSLADLDEDRRRHECAQHSRSQSMSAVRCADAGRSRRHGRTAWGRVVADRCPGTLPDGRVRGGGILPCGPHLWRSVADARRERGGARGHEEGASTSDRAGAQHNEGFGLARCLSLRQGSSPVWAETRYGARGVSLKPGPVQPEPLDGGLHDNPWPHTAIRSTAACGDFPRPSRVVGSCVEDRRGSQPLPPLRSGASCVQIVAPGWKSDETPKPTYLTAPP